MLYRKGPGMEAKLCFIGHALMENRHGLFVDTRLTRVSGHAERLAALEMIEPRARPEAITLGGDRGFDAADFVMELRDINVTPHIAQNTSRRCHRWTHDPSPRLCRQPPHAQAHRGRLWLDKDYRRSQKDKISRIGQGRMVIHHGCRSLQSHPPAEAHRCRMTWCARVQPPLSERASTHPCRPGNSPAKIRYFFNSLLECRASLSHGRPTMIFRQLFDSVSGTYTYLLASRPEARR